MQLFPCALLSLQATTIVNNTRNRNKNSVDLWTMCIADDALCKMCDIYKMMFAHSIMSLYMIDVVGNQGIPGLEYALFINVIYVQLKSVNTYTIQAV